jgi:hypothetical protein
LILEHIGDIERIVVDATFDEFQQQALDAKDASLGRLRQMHAAAVTHAAEQAQIKKDREELEASRAKLAKLEAEAEARRKEDERQAKVRLDAEAAAQAETLRKQREESDRESAERQRVIDEEAARQRAENERIRLANEAAAKAERARIAAENAAAKEARDAEDLRLRTAREDIERREAELNAPKVPAPTPAAPLTRGGATVKVPSADEIVQVIARQYKCHTDTARDWLASMDFRKQERAA